MSIIRNGLLSADLDVPVTSPTLNLDFANSQSLDKRITFTRGSIGTRVNRNGLIETIAANQPRFDFDPISGECRGLLIEESRQNLLAYSDIEGTVGTQPTNMSFAISSGQSALVSTDVSLGPNGKSCKHIRGVGGDNNLGFMGSSFATAGSTYVFSAYVYIPSSLAKNFSGKYIAFQMEQPGTYVPAFADVTIVDRWQRVFGTCVPSTTAVTWILRTTAVAGSFLYTDCWQIEQGAFPTSYIPTTASTVTRSADLASMTGTNFSSWYNQSEGTLYASARVNALGSSGYPGIAYIDDGTIDNSMGFYVNDNLDDKIGAEAYISGKAQYALFSSSATTANKLNKAISSYSINNFSAAFYTSSQIQRDTSGSIPTVNRLRIGALRGGLYPLNGTISRLTYYPRALKPNQLQTLTS